MRSAGRTAWIGLIAVAAQVAAWSLAACAAPPLALSGPSPSPEQIRSGASPSPSLSLSVPAFPADYTPSPSLKATGVHPLPLPPTPAPTPTPVPSPSPTAPPAEAPLAGTPLALSLEKLYEIDGHLTAAVSAPLAGQPAFVLASLGRRVICLDEDGVVRWQAWTAGPVYALALLEADRVVAGDDAGYVTAFDASGRRLWRHLLGSRVTALAPWRGGLLAGGWDERLTWLGTEGGEERVRWQVEAGGPVSGIVALPDLAVVASLDGQVRAFDESGTEAWRLDVGAAVARLGTGLQEPPSVLVGVQDGRLLAVGPDGMLLWEQALGEGCPVWGATRLDRASDPVLVVGTGGAAPVLGLLSARGEWLWRVTVPSPVGAVAALDLDPSASLKATRSLQATGDDEVEILAGLADGQVLVLDGHGRLRASAQAELHVWDIRLSESTGGTPALVLAGLAAWRLVEGAGPGVAPRLVPPAMLVAPPSSPSGSLKATTEGEATLAFLGDVCLGRTMEAQLIRYGPAYAWRGLGPLLGAADLAVANLEVSLTTRGRPLSKTYLLRAHPLWRRALGEAGLDLVTVANNHALDYGDAGLDDTLAALAQAGIAVVGAGRSADEAQRPALLTVNGVRVAILGYLAARWNGSVDVPATPRLAWDDPAQVQAGVRAARGQADVVIVLVHNGVEYAARPSASQVAVAHAAVDAGADLVVGHHPHVTQTVERYHDGLIVYSLGDALFDILVPRAMQGELLRVQVTREGLARAELWPFWIDDAIQPRLLDDGSGQPRSEVIYP